LVTVAEGRIARTRTSCRLCGGSAMRNAVPLKPLPVASPNVGGSSVTETAACDLWRCENCGHLQLGVVINPEFQYRNFQYFTGISLGLREHFSRFLHDRAAMGDIGSGKLVLDIGSNDGSLLKIAKSLGARVLGIDPAETLAAAANADGIETIADFFTPDRAAQMAASHGRADMVISNNTVANIDDLEDFFKGIDIVLATDGVVVVETQYALDMIEKTLLDVIYHEHISYFAVAPMERFLAARGFELFDAEEIAPKGGSIRFLAQRKGGRRPVSARVGALKRKEEAAGLYSQPLYDAFSSRVEALGAAIKGQFAARKAEGKRAVAFGASVGCAALIHFFQLDEVVDAVFDDVPLTNVLQTPSGGIPVLTGAQLRNEAPTDVIILAWRYAGHIATAHEAFGKRGGRFFQALPAFAEVER